MWGLRCTDERSCQPPQSFQPPPPPEGASTGDAAPVQQRQQQGKLAHTDLITRYGLSSKITAAAADGDAAEKEKAKATWSQNKIERQSLLQRRKEEMILEARRKLEEQDRGRVGRG